MDAIRIQAKFVIASDARIYHPGLVTVREGRIVDVGLANNQTAEVDLGDVTLLPGLVNPHTHLEFSDLETPFSAGVSFPDWISQVVAHRRRLEKERGHAGWSAHLHETIERGIDESQSCGIVALADIVSIPWNTDTLVSTGRRLGNQPAIAATEPSIQRHLQLPQRPRVFAFPEIIGLTHERLDATLDWALNFHASNFGSSAAADELLGFGLSPHAPYSLLLDRVVQSLRDVRGRSLLAMHLAESRDELEWLEQGTGAFKDSFERLGLPLPERRGTIDDAIALLASGKRSMLIHGNYLSREQARKVAEAKSISVVYCPRTHSHFGHDPYPLALYQDLQIPVLIGTDSRASNPDLNLWSDMVHARSLHSRLAPQQALNSITAGPALALEIADDYGAIAVGKLAHLNTVTCQPHWNAKNILEELTSTATRLTPLADSLTR